MAPRHTRRSLLRFGLASAAAAVPFNGEDADASSPSRELLGLGLFHLKGKMCDGDLGNVRKGDVSLAVKAFADGSGSLDVYTGSGETARGSIVSLPAPIGRDLLASLASCLDQEASQPT